jgi:hypothetical protein
VAEMHTGFGIGQQLVAEDALVDLAAVLFRLAQLRFGGDFGAAGHETRHQFGRVVDQSLQAHELAPIVGQPVVERAGMAA